MAILRFLIILLLVLNALAFAAVAGWLGSGPPAGEPGRIAAQLHPERIRLAGEAAGSGLAPGPVAQTLAVSEPAPPSAAETAATPAPAEPAPAPAAAIEAVTPAAAAPEAAIDGFEPSAADAAPAASAPPTGAPLPSGEPAAVPAPAAPALCHAWGDLTASEADRLVQRLRRIGITPVRSRSETPESWWVRIPPQGSRAEAERRVVELNLLGVTDTFIVQEAGPTQHAVSLGLFKTESRARVLLGQLRAKGVENAGVEPRMATSHHVQANIPSNELRIAESAAPGLRAKRRACAR